MAASVVCPVCGSDRVAVSGGNVYFCRKCRTAVNAAHQILPYSTEYFTTEYNAQYGLTYEEDFPNIYRASKTRIDRIKTTLGVSSLQGKSVLDLGSALGFFLKAAVDSGAEKVTGVEVSKYASAFARDRLGIKTINTGFERIDFDDKFDIITAWFFIEHCADTVGVIRKISGLLKPGGILAFSVPSVFGPQFLLNREKWLRERPVDHKIDLSPRSAAILLKNAGFHRIRTYPSGMHPDRVFNSRGFLFRPLSAVYRLFSRMTGFSDTIEVYAVKRSGKS